MSNTVFRSKRPFAAYRIGSPAHPLLDGTGAAASDDARWNSKGRYVIYAAEHYATALLEKAAQLNGIKIPRTLMFVRIGIPAGATTEEVRPEDWLGGTLITRPRAGVSATAGTMTRDHSSCLCLR